jgi:hypothetical protein
VRRARGRVQACELASVPQRCAAVLYAMPRRTLAGEGLGRGLACAPQPRGGTGRSIEHLVGGVRMV